MPIGLAVAVAGAAGALARYLLDFCAGDYLESHHPVYVTFSRSTLAARCSSRDPRRVRAVGGRRGGSHDDAGVAGRDLRTGACH